MRGRTKHTMTGHAYMPSQASHGVNHGLTEKCRFDGDRLGVYSALDGVSILMTASVRS